MAEDRYPELRRLITGYFYQGCYDDDGDEATILAEFVATSHAHEVARALADIGDFRRAHPHGIKAAAEAEFQPDMGLGETDEEVVETLARYARALGGG